MKTPKRFTFCFPVFLIFIFLVISNPCLGEVMPGTPAPSFSLQDVYGRDHKLSAMTDHSLIVLYFFNTESSSSQDGLASLNKLIKEFNGADFVVWGITKSGKAKVSDFILEKDVGFPVMLDNAGISSLYGAELILPTVYILGPDLKVIDYFQGGGKTTEKMLVKLAERELQRDDIEIAQAISKEVQQNNPDNIEAKTIYGYAALKAEKLDEAEDIFTQISEQNNKAQVLGDEGLAAVFAKKGETKKALAKVNEVKQKAPERGFVNVIEGDILYSQNKKDQARIAYEEAVKKPEAQSYQKSLAYNQLGRLHASIGNYQNARQLYDQAIEIDPYYVEAMSNKGVAFEKDGQLDKALNSYQQAMAINKSDTFSAILAKKAQNMIDLQRDIAQKKRIDSLVKELAERFHSNQESPFSFFKDKWTSRPMILSFVDFQEKGGLAEREGLSMVLTTQLGDLLNDSGRVQIVERVLIDRLLEELNLGSSELADPTTALKLGKILAAKIVATGSLLNLPDTTLLSLRLIDTETTKVPKVLTKKLNVGVSALEGELDWLNREILKTVIKKYPLRGYVVQASADQILLNLGSEQGVVLGAKFDVIEEGKPIKYKGRKLRGLPKKIAQLEIIQVEPDMSSARILSSKRQPQEDDKIQEIFEQLPQDGNHDS